MESNTINFFENLSQRLNSENNLSDITLALTQTSFKFKKFFFEFFFADNIETENIDKVIKDAQIYREYTKGDSRPDFYIRTSNGNFLIEIKKYDKDYHFKKYNNNFQGSEKALLSIDKLNKADCKVGETYKFTMKTWNELYTELKKEEFIDTEQPLIKGYLKYIKNICNIINHEEMDNLLQKFRKKKEEIQKIFVEDQKLLNFLAKETERVMNINSFIKKENSISVLNEKHYYNEKNECSKKFRFWVDINSMKFNPFFRAVYELYGRNNVKYGEKLKEVLTKKYGELKKEENGGVMIGGGSGSDYFHIYYLEIPFEFSSENFSKKLNQAIKDNFFDKDYIKIAIIELNGIIKKEEDEEKNKK